MLAPGGPAQRNAVTDPGATTTMAARSTWKGFIRLSLVSVPVKAYTATASGGGDISLNQLHADCHSRVNYRKVCPVHGELKGDQIVSGYEYAKDQYVVVNPDELEKLRPASDRGVQIAAFVPPDTIDPLLYTGKSYYLLPEGPVAFKPYALLVEGMKEQRVEAVATVVMHNRDQLVLLRPVGKLLTMVLLSFENQVVRPATFEADAPDPNFSDEELGLVKMLIKASTPKKFDLTGYRDTYVDKLTQLIEAKVQGREIVTPPAADEEAQVINLMDALRQSVAKVQAGKTEAGAPPKRVAKSVPPKSAPAKKRKSS
jgi:DNA end-binding protein Ku